MKIPQAVVLAIAAAALVGCSYQGAQPNAPKPMDLTAGDERKNTVDGAEMVYIPAGEFKMGDDDIDVIKGDNPRHTVKLSGYWMYKNLVTVGQYRKFCAATFHAMPDAPPFNAGWRKEDHPIVDVNWDDAVAYAKWAQADLPTAAQWEKAARGTDGRKYPWGNKFYASKLWCGESVPGDSGGTHRVGELGVSPYGCTDMAGNALQWCKDWYADDYWKSDHGPDPGGPTIGGGHVLRGGSWGVSGTDYFRCAARYAFTPGHGHGDYGFRCVRN